MYHYDYRHHENLKIFIIASEEEAETALRLHFDRTTQLYKTKCFYEKEETKNRI